MTTTSSSSSPSSSSNPSPEQLLVGSGVAFVLGYVSIAWLLKFVANHSFAWFAAYRIPLGLLVMALLGTEEVNLDFDESGVRRIAEVAYQVNENTENIGARRLHTVLERLLETISFEASDKSGSKLIVDAGYVDDHLTELSQDEDLSRYIL